MYCIEYTYIYIVYLYLTLIYIYIKVRSLGTLAESYINVVSISQLFWHAIYIFIGNFLESDMQTHIAPKTKSSQSPKTDAQCSQT